MKTKYHIKMHPLFSTFFIHILHTLTLIPEISHTNIKLQN